MADGRPDRGLTADDLVAAAGGALLARSDRPILGGAVDSREVRPGNLFVALPGERTDGHRFVVRGRSRRARPACSSRALPDDVDPALGRRDDRRRRRTRCAALQAVATRLARSGSTRSSSGSPGSIAKTSTKEAVATVLGAAMPTLSNEGNLNNEIGLPLTVLRLRSEHRAAVLEMGMYVGGEIADLARIGRPEIGIVTAVQPVHLSRIGTIEAIEQAKGELVEALPADGVAILNADDERVRRMAARTRAQVRHLRVRAGRRRARGGGRVARRRRDGASSSSPDGGRAARRRDPDPRPAGRPQRAGRRGRGSGRRAAGRRRSSTRSPRGWSAPHRAQLVRAGGVTIVDDTYNASPGSVAAALELLAGLPGRRIAVLGEMLELGAEHESGHRQAGEAAAAVVDRLVVVGDGRRGIAAGALAAGLDARRRLDGRRPRRRPWTSSAGTSRPGDVVLVKASRGVALDLLVDDLVAALGGPETTGR